MLRTGYGLIMLILLTLVAGGCSDTNPDAPTGAQAHPQGWLAMHPAEPGAQGDAAACAICHGVDFTGSGNVVSCFACHMAGPPFGKHPSWWVNGTLDDHQCFFNIDDPAQRLSWTGCATANCHGADLQGGAIDVPTGPSCFSVSFTDEFGVTSTCHATGPPAPHATPFTDPTLHGPGAKDALGNNLSMGNYCIYCHGRPENSFDGGYVSDPAILNSANGACTLCHTAATAHPTDWVRTTSPTPTYYHSNVSAQTITVSCALCHNTAYLGAGPMPGAPSCFSSTFTNDNSTASGCHPTGPGGAPHTVPFTDPALHGPAAKLDLVGCQECHGTPGGAGSNPTFNVSIGALNNGCENCHPAGAAHPGGTERWTFRRNTSDLRYTHFASGNVTTACALCHNVSAGDVAGAAPPCTGCHTAPAAPGFTLDCTVCHDTPPTTGSIDITGAVLVDHGGAAAVGLHEVCSICHGASDDGSGALVAKSADYQLFNAADPLLRQGGDHLDGRLEMNGPTGVGTAYNPVNLGCDIACHGNDAAHQLPNSSELPIAYGNYGSGSAACDSCHGYPPTGVGGVAPLPVSHLFDDSGATLLTAHGGCLYCHGNKDDGTGTHSPTGDYDVAIDHATGNINMNLDTQYNAGNQGCDAACHGNDAAHQLPNSSGFPVVLGSYGSGGAGSCAGCHDTGVGGAPQVVQNVSSHTSGYTCEACHVGHGQGNVLIPNNPEAGIAYPAAGHNSGISLGSASVSGATEAEICWTCHDSEGISEWAFNTDTNGAAPNYDFGSLNQSNWVGATWNSANFGYKAGAISSMHAADFSAAGPGNDLVGDLHCSYCHDVHNVGAQGFRNGYDNGGSPPYLMGTWMGNPYKEDGAPTGAYNAYSFTENFGAVPRGWHSVYANASNADLLGGWQIDQNNGNPTSGWTANGSAGLCEACHGNGDGTWSAAEINGLNYFGDPSLDWVGANGHANAVLGGDGSGRFNVYRPSLRGEGSTYTNPKMGYQTNGTGGADGSRMYGLRNYGGNSQSTAISNISTDNNRGVFPYAHSATDNEVRYAYRAGRTSNFTSVWGVDQSEATAQLQYHRFSCSKCHNPHASRLPRLMITNCLDVTHNTWDDNFSADPDWTSGGANGATVNWSTVGVMSVSGSTELAYAKSAQNCHRYISGVEAGWNNVTPW